MQKTNSTATINKLEFQKSTLKLLAYKTDVQNMLLKLAAFRKTLGTLKTSPKA